MLTSIIKSKKYSSKQTRILYAIVLVFTVFFLMVWLLWWSAVKPQIFKLLGEKMQVLHDNLSAFNEDFSPTYTEFAVLEDKQYPESIVIASDTTKTSEEVFDSTYYYYLWDVYIQEFGLNEMDSLSIDSMIREEMKRTTMPETLIDDNQESFTIKKEELLFVTSVKPVFKPDSLSGADSIANPIVSSISYTIEFWQSPLNLQGVKTTGNLILIYGVSDFHTVSLKMNAQLKPVLQIRNIVYQLKNDGRFYSFKELQIR